MDFPCWGSTFSWWGHSHHMIHIEQEAEALPGTTNAISTPKGVDNQSCGLMCLFSK